MEGMGKVFKGRNIVYMGTIVDNGCDSVLGSGHFYIV